MNISDVQKFVEALGRLERQESDVADPLCPRSQCVGRYTLTGNDEQQPTMIDQRARCFDDHLDALLRS